MGLTSEARRQRQR